MRHADLRYVYRPAPERLPRWLKFGLWRLWALL